MERYFNTEGTCIPEQHYMVRLDGRVETIKRRLVDRGKYFVINRGRQYGKTTTLRALGIYLRGDYLVASLDFQEIGTAEYRDENTFARAFAEVFVKAFRRADVEGMEELIAPIVCAVGERKEINLRELFVLVSELCGKSPKPIVLIIDEVDSAANNRVFLDFLALLRRYYLDRENQNTFHSVVLAGVYDIKNLKLKLRPESESQYNSPWNVAAQFDVGMSFTVAQVAGMLKEYEQDRNTGMDLKAVSEEICQYTRGYPYLVSAICKLLDEKIFGREEFEDGGKVWTKEGIAEAVKLLLKMHTPLFDSLTKQLYTYPDLKKMMEDIIYQGKRITFSPFERAVNLGVMFGFLREENKCVVVANRVFEMVLLDLFMAEESVSSEAYRYGDRDRNQFIRNGRLDMEKVLQKFVAHFSDIYGGDDERFVEEHGRKFFLLYLKPIINGVGNYYLEAQTRDAKRTDVIVDYQGEQFVVELKIWHGSEYNERGEKQLADYLDYYHKDKGYMLSFNFNKNKEPGVKEIKVGDKVIVEAVV